MTKVGYVSLIAATKQERKMGIEIDPDVQRVAEFMQSRLMASRLVPVATAIAKLAPILWGRYSVDEVAALTLGNGQISDSATPRQAAIECAPAPTYADDGSAVAAVRANRGDAVAAAFASIYTGIRRCRARLVDRIEFGTVRWLYKLRIFVCGHNGAPRSFGASRP
jgi:hypothetical protein